MSLTKPIHTSKDVHVANIDWYEQIKRNIPKSSYQLDLTTSTKNDAELAHQIFLNRVKKAYLNNPNHHQIPPLFDFSSNTNLSMKGIAIIATYLREKKNLTNLFVCETRESLQLTLANFSRSTTDVRASFIFPTCKYNPPYAQETETEHIVTIGFEKTGAKIKVVFFESLGMTASEIKPDIIQDDAKKLERTKIDFDNAALWYIFHSKLNMANTSVYFTTTCRQSRSTGCETFATRDAVDFLLCPNFFTLIETKPFLSKGKNRKQELSFVQITTLPPGFMKSAQSMKAIRAYQQNYTNLSKHPFHYRQTEIQTLAHSLANHKVTLKPYPKEESTSKKTNSNDQKEINNQPPLINDYTFRRSRKYKLMLVETCKMLSPGRINEIISKSLIPAPVKVDQEIRTLNDLQQEQAKKIKSRL